MMQPSTDWRILVPQTFPSAPMINPDAVRFNLLIGSLFLLIPLGFGVASALYHRNQQRRQLALHEQRRRLERLWQMSSNP